jgi:hypothetical protein
MQWNEGITVAMQRDMRRAIAELFACEEGGNDWRGLFRMA